MPKRPENTFRSCGMKLCETCSRWEKAFSLFNCAVQMPVKFLKQAFLFLPHENGQVVFPERQLKMYAADIGVNDMRHDIKRAVRKPCAACRVTLVIKRECAGLHIAEAELNRIWPLPVKERERSGLLTGGCPFEAEGKTFKAGNFVGSS